MKNLNQQIQKVQNILYCIVRWVTLTNPLWPRIINLNINTHTHVHFNLILRNAPFYYPSYAFAGVWLGWWRLMLFHVLPSQLLLRDTVSLTSRQIMNVSDATLIYWRSTDCNKTEHPRFISFSLILENGPESFLSQWNLRSLAGCVKLHARGKQEISYDISRFSLTPHRPSISVD